MDLFQGFSEVDVQENFLCKLNLHCHFRLSVLCKILIVFNLEFYSKLLNLLISNPHTFQTIEQA